MEIVCDIIIQFKIVHQKSLCCICKLLLALQSNLIVVLPAM
jgi:hypothetical protein